MSKGVQRLVRYGEKGDHLSERMRRNPSKVACGEIKDSSNLLNGACDFNNLDREMFSILNTNATLNTRTPIMIYVNYHYCNYYLGVHIFI